MLHIITTLTANKLLNIIWDYALLKKIRRAKYLKNYKEQRKKHFKEVKVTLDIKSYKEFQRLAKLHDTTLNKQIVAQAIAYQNSNYLVPKDINDNLVKLIYLFRNIANNINQIAKHSNIFKKLISTNKILTNLKSLEMELIEFIRKPKLKDDNKIPQ